MACENPCDCPLHKFDAVAPPTGNDDGCDTSGNGTFCPGSYWYDTITGTLYIMTDDTCTNAQWVDLKSKETLTHWKGYVVPPQVVAEADFNVPLDVVEAYNANPGDTWDAGQKELTVEKTGFYILSGDLLTQINNNTPRWVDGPYIQLLLYVNGAFNATIIRDQSEPIPNVNTDVYGKGVTTVQLTAGDILQVRVSHRLGQTISLVDDEGSRRNQWSIDRLPDFQPV